MTESSLRVLQASDPADRQAWLDHWSEWPAREVQSHPAYVSAFAEAGGRACAAVYRSDAGSVLFAFVLRDVEAAAGPLGAGLADITSPYGYGGAYAWGVNDREGLGDEFWTAFDRWSRDNGIVSEFLRLSLFDQDVLPYPGSRTAKQDNVVVDVSLEPDDLWMSFDHKVRKNVNKARRSGIHIEVDTDGTRFADFARIYAATMDRRGASSGYYFPNHFFEAIHRELPGQFAYFHAVHEGTVVSTELVLLSQESSYSFLGGTVSEAYALRPNDLLKFEIARWSAENGRRWFVLGGGYEPDDGIFRYKRAFAPDGVRPFFVGTRIVDDAAYQRLSEDHRARATETPDAGFFPAYRA